MPDAPLVFCYDGSVDAKYGIERASDLLAPRPALVLTVWEPAPVLGPGLDGSAVMVNGVELDRAAAEAAGRIAEEGVHIARDAGLESESVAIKAAGPVWQTIVEFAHRHGAAAIVMGSRGLTGLRSMLLGSVSRGVAQHARRPTMVIHPPGEDSPSARDARFAGLRATERSS